MKRISRKKCLDDVWEKGNTYICDKGKAPSKAQYFRWGALAQLEACEKEHDAEMRELFEKIENSGALRQHHYIEKHYPYMCVRCAYQALKEKYL